ncbi:anaerobic sulfatase maturase [candidate division KSB3 bacterium]|uniref:Anaerobic sulfatase maturase n=1 Tax=candidate division KSB3 bacterium TaxID=2044937 RepID=A0A2G6E121_9BACT|nr:MAG: anaerobic sulfatase maturase [candidate division KSB3 bacterium]PIE28435.1 MAG: anaerobic sulfatase maturase [candidate division KSB3 bacterium]
MKAFSLLVKPASADCNLRCEYCFYLEKCRLYPEESRHRMSDDVLEQMLKSYMAVRQPFYSLVWQGGEPTLMGLEFFQKVVSFQKQYGRPGSRIGNALQTNAAVISHEMAAFFQQYHFLIGCSLDGPAGLHDRYRLTAGGTATHALVLQGIEILEAHQLDCNILVLVSQANVAHAREVYRYLRDRGFLFQQYIPCVEFDEKGELCHFALSGEEWGTFLCELFDEWWKKDVHKVSVRHFDSILAKLLDGQAAVCTLGTNCCQYLVVEYNGDVYPCDFFVDPELKLGNVMENSWEEMLQSPIYLDFGSQKSHWNQACESCDCLDICAGDCLKHRIYAGNPPQHLSVLCSGWKRFLRHSRKRFEKLAGTIRKQRLREVRASQRSQFQTRSATASAGRNDPCPCGSGKKFKKCCGR